MNEAITVVDTQEYFSCLYPKRKVQKNNNILIFGGDSNLVSRMLKPIEPFVLEYYPNTTCTPIYFNNKPKLETCCLPIYDNKWFHYRNLESINYPIDGIITAVPTYLHYTLTERFSKQRKPIWLEKPICLPREINKMGNLLKMYPEYILCSDFFLDSYAFLWILQNLNYIKSIIGKIKEVNGRLVEPWGVSPEREWLLNKSLSGGGIGYDALVHVVTLIHILLDRMGIKTNIKIKNVELARYENHTFQNLKKKTDNECETYMYIEATCDDIDILIDGGKGVDTYYYGINIVGTEGSVEIFTGIDGVGKCNPYIKLETNKRKNKLLIFKGGSVGYKSFFLQFLSILSKQNSYSPYTREERAKSALFSVRFLSDSYKAHNKPLASYPRGTTPQFGKSVKGQLSRERKDYLNNLADKHKTPLHFNLI